MATWSTRKALALSVVLATILLGGAQTWATELQAHRGGRGLMPENTLPAFVSALELGVDTLELDTAITADGHVVISHDPVLKPRLARREGVWITDEIPISSLTLAELRQFDVGRLDPESRYAKRYKRQRAVDGTAIPLLSDLFALVKRRGSKVGFNIETKIAPTTRSLTRPPAEFAQLLLSAIDAAQMRERVTIQSFDWSSLSAFAKIAPEIPRVHLTAEQNWLDNIQRDTPGPSPWLAGTDVDDYGGSIPAMVKASGGTVWSPYHRDLTETTLRQAQALGLKVVVWTVNRPADMQRYIAMGVDGLITDYPDLGMTAVKAK
ncbi:MAG: glycerophosphodiester phosphodiesterase [Rhodospirillaceae bacterium]|nr:glycerophosphodiester phosphodiesterase [Rhodospirillaceae bacterium]